jgi:hypothetical protein
MLRQFSLRLLLLVVLTGFFAVVGTAEPLCTGQTLDSLVSASCLSQNSLYRLSFGGTPFAVSGSTNVLPGSIEIRVDGDTTTSLVVSFTSLIDDSFQNTASGNTTILSLAYSIQPLTPSYGIVSQTLTLGNARIDDFGAGAGTGDLTGQAFVNGPNNVAVPSLSALRW